MQATLSRDELIDRARTLVPVLAERAFEAERQHQLPSETVTDLHGRGLLLAGRGAFRAQCPERLARVAGGWDPAPAQARLASPRPSPPG